MTESARYPYKTHARKESHPARLGALARLSGVDAPLAESASVLEIGCGNGGNIIPLAATYPDSRFVGFDLSQELIETGKNAIQSLGLKNIELSVGDIAQYQSTKGAFDYVICHGVYSWVAPELQTRILKIGRDALAEHGVFFMSYNTLPGWRQRGVLRDILQVGSRLSKTQDEGSRYTAAMELAKLLQTESSALPAYVHEAVERLKSSEPSYVIQEFLGEYNTPVLFMDFMQAAELCDLQFLSEARVVMMSAEDLSPALRSYVDSLESDSYQKEQVLDLVRNRTFRETILCRSELSLNRGLSTGAFKELIFVANYIPLGPGEGGRARFRERATERELLAPRGECEQVLSVMAAAGTRGVTVGELTDGIAATLALSPHDLLRVLVTLWRTGFCDAVTAPLCGVREDALVSPFAVMQASGADKVTSALHDSYPLSPLERRAITLAERPLSFADLETQLLPFATKEEARSSIARLREKGFFR